MMALLKFTMLVMISAAGACGIGTVCTAAYLYTGGIAAVDVETADVDLFLPVPLRVVDVGLGIARLAAPDEVELDAAAQRRLEELSPMIERLVDELGSLPEGEIVRIEDGEHLVVVEQRRGHLRVAVDSPEARVRVSVPQKGARRVSRQALAFAGR